MRLTKRQLKRIIREEYSRLKRKGLIKEMAFQSNPNMQGQEYFTKDQTVHSAALQMVEDMISDYGLEVVENLHAMNLTARDIDDMAGGWDDSPEAEAVSDAFESMDIEGSGNYPAQDVAQALAQALGQAGQWSDMKRSETRLTPEQMKWV